MICDHCGGLGWYPGTCDACMGQGCMYCADGAVQAPCPACDGTGDAPDEHPDPERAGGRE